MKRLLFLLLLIPSLVFGQKKVSDMPAATSVANPDLIMVVQGGTNKKATKSTLQSELYDSIAIHLDTIQSHSDSILIYRDSIDNLNARIVILENDDETGPVIDSAVVLNASADTVRIWYSKAITGDIDTLDIDILVNGWYVGIKDPIISTPQVKVPLDSSIVEGNTIQAHYFKPSTGGVTDVYGNQAEDTTVSVTNRVEPVTPDVAVLLAAYDYEDGYTSSVSSTYDMSASGGMEVDSEEAPQGSYVGKYDGSNNYTYTSTNFSLTNTYTIWMAVKIWGVLDYDRCLLEVGGVRLFANMADRQFELRTKTGSDSASAYSDTCIVPGEWASLMVTVDKTNGLTDGVHFRYNKLDEDLDSIVRNDFSVIDTLIVGADATNDHKAYAYKDYLRIYSGILTDVESDVIHDGLTWHGHGLDTIAPSPDTANVGIQGDSTVWIHFTEDIKESYTDLTSWNWFVDGVEKTISSQYISGDAVYLGVPGLEGGETCRIRYDSTGTADMTDLVGNYVDTFNIEVYNGIESNVTPLAVWFVEGDGQDNQDNYDATVNLGSFSTSIYKQGSQSLNGTGTSYMTSGAIPMATTDDSVFYAFQYIYYTGTDRYADFISSRYVNDWGWEVGCDQVDGHVTVQIENEDDDIATFYSANGVLTSGTWHSVGVLFKMDTDSIYVDVDGTQVSGFAMPWNFPTTGAVTVGRGKGVFNAYIDAIHLYNGQPSVGQRSDLHTSPGTVLSGGGGGECDCGGTYPDDCDPCPSDDFDIILSQDFDHWDDDETIPFEYEAYHHDLYPTGERHMNEDFNVTGSMWRDSDVGWRNAQGIAALAPNYSSWGETYQRYTRTWRDSIVYNLIDNSPSLQFTPRYNTAGSPTAAWAALNTGDVNTYSSGERSEIHFDKVREAFFSIDVTIGDGFEMNRGGKFIGVLMGPPYRRIPQVPLPTEGASYHLVYKNGGLATYAYYYNMPATSLDWPVNQYYRQFQPTGNDGGLDFLYDENGMFLLRTSSGDRAYTITLRFVMNNGQQEDGYMECYINGYQIGRTTGCRWVYEGWPTNGIDGLELAFLIGGGEPFQGALRDEIIQYDNIYIYTISDTNTQSGYTPLQYFDNGADDNRKMYTPNDFD